MTRVSPPQAQRLAAPCVTRQSKSQARPPNTHTHTHIRSHLPVICQVQAGSERVFNGAVAVLWLIALRPKLTAGGLWQ